MLSSLVAKLRSHRCFVFFVFFTDKLENELSRFLCFPAGLFSAVGLEYMRNVRLRNTNVGQYGTDVI